MTVPISTRLLSIAANGAILCGGDLGSFSEAVQVRNCHERHRAGEAISTAFTE